MKTVNHVSVINSCQPEDPCQSLEEWFMFIRGIKQDTNGKIFLSGASILDIETEEQKTQRRWTMMKLDHHVNQVNYQQEEHPFIGTTILVDFFRLARYILTLKGGPS